MEPHVLLLLVCINDIFPDPSFSNIEKKNLCFTHSSIFAFKCLCGKWVYWCGIYVSFLWCLLVPIGKAIIVSICLLMYTKQGYLLHCIDLSFILIVPQIFTYMNWLLCAQMDDIYYAYISEARKVSRWLGNMGESRRCSCGSVEWVR